MIITSVHRCHPERSRRGHGSMFCQKKKGKKSHINLSGVRRITRALAAASRAGGQLGAAATGREERECPAAAGNLRAEGRRALPPLPLHDEKTQITPSNLNGGPVSVAPPPSLHPLQFTWLPYRFPRTHPQRALTDPGNGAISTVDEKWRTHRSSRVISAVRSPTCTIAPQNNLPKEPLPLIGAKRSA